MNFINRVQAGQLLAKQLLKYKDAPDTLVLGLPRGGVVVSYEVAKALDLPMDINIVRKIGIPSNPELAVGALTASGTIYLNKPLMESMGLTVDMLTPIIETEKKEALRRLHTYRGDLPPLEIKDKTIILVDDGIATGATMRVAIQSVKLHGAKKIIVAVPVGSSQEVSRLKREVDEVVCLHEPEEFWGIGHFYENFAPVADEEVVELMQRA